MLEKINKEIKKSKDEDKEVYVPFLDKETQEYRTKEEIDIPPFSKWDNSGFQEVLILKDPRPDLAEGIEGGVEHLLWLQLFAAAWKKDKELAITLQGFRAQGCRLVASGKDQYKYRIEPILGVLGWPNEEEYKKAREKYLVPKGKILMQLLKELE
ncbi:hypothetical protein [Thermosyntropha sp.]|uniref:hypothetical protein n=1 Tax=Thermosyntropha sp. TaxID=2740820 RepID=UPI0025ECED97|nr:hypothetical protein [Thermosyntropha sp.]MBO8158845.1 hypothetical protein [Thermosyntropha sp.]